MEAKDRLEDLLLELGMSSTDFSRKSGFDKSQISQWRSGGRGISDKNLMEIAKVTGCNLKWLKSGRGKMFTEQMTHSGQGRNIVVIIIPEN